MDKGLLLAKHLVAYVNLHQDTQRALILYNHLAQLEYLVGVDISLTPPELLVDGRFASLHDHDAHGLVGEALRRISCGLVPENWDEILEKIFLEKGVKLQRII